MKDFTDITFILDRSGSMCSTVWDVIGGFNSFVKDQKEVGDNASLTLIQFDENYEVNYFNTPIKEVVDLNTHTYKPRGVTALYDAIGKAITDKGNELNSLPEQDRPNKVLFIIYTDGLENASVEFHSGRIKEMIEHQTNKYNWDFTFLGAGQDAVLTGQTIGVEPDKSLTYSQVGIGKGAAFASVSNYTRSLRSTGQAQYSLQDRDTQDKLIAEHGE